MEKQYEVKITRRAEQSMREIGLYFAVDLMAPETAIRMLRTFQTQIQKLAVFPGRVHYTPEEPWHSLGVRRKLVQNYYLYFWIDEENSRVQIMDVVYAKQDQQRKLEAMPMKEK